MHIHTHTHTFQMQPSERCPAEVTGSRGEGGERRETRRGEDGEEKRGWKRRKDRVEKKKGRRRGEGREERDRKVEERTGEVLCCWCVHPEPRSREQRAAKERRETLKQRVSVKCSKSQH